MIWKHQEKTFTKFIYNEWELINYLKDEIKKEEKLSEEKNKKIPELSNMDREKEQKINELTDKMAQLKEENKKLKAASNSISNREQIIALIDEIKDKERELKNIKSNLSFELLPGEKLMNVIIISVDQKIHIPIICKNTDIFTRLENIIYENYPEYSESENFFMVNGSRINKYKSLEFNKIKNNDIITLKQFTFDI